MDWLIPLVLLAQEQAAQPNGAGGGVNPWVQMFPPLVIILVLFYFIIVLPEKKRQQQVKKLEAVKEKDHVITTGGIFGVVTNVQRDVGRVTLRVDETTGAKIKISLAAIAQILGDEEPETKDNVKDKP